MQSQDGPNHQEHPNRQGHWATTHTLLVYYLYHYTASCTSIFLHSRLSMVIHPMVVLTMADLLCCAHDRLILDTICRVLKQKRMQL